MDFKTPGRNETLQTAFYDQCMKHDHPNVLICPAESESALRIPNPDIARNVQILENKLKEIKQRTKKQKKGKRKQSKKGRAKRRKMKRRRGKGMGKNRRRWRKGKRMRKVKIQDEPTVGKFRSRRRKSGP